MSSPTRPTTPQNLPAPASVAHTNATSDMNSRRGPGPSNASVGREVNATNYHQNPTQATPTSQSMISSPNQQTTPPDLSAPASVAHTFAQSNMNQRCGPGPSNTPLGPELNATNYYPKVTQTTTHSQSMTCHSYSTDAADQQSHEHRDT